MICICTALGMHGPLFFPTGTGRDYKESPYLEMLTREYALDAMQQAEVRALLTLRRNKFTALFDATPHPSIRLSRLVPLLERVIPPK